MSRVAFNLSFGADDVSLNDCRLIEGSLVQFLQQFPSLLPRPSLIYQSGIQREMSSSFTTVQRLSEDEISTSRTVAEKEHIDEDGFLSPAALPILISEKRLIELNFFMAKD